jgi:proline iminopeptidase
MEQTTKPPYTHSSAFDEGFLEVSPIHKLHYEQYGKSDGKPGTLKKINFYHKDDEI